MYFPVQITIGSLHLPLHTICETIGIFVGFRYFLYLKAQHSDAISSANRVWILMGAIIGSVAGSRLLGGIENIPAMQQATNKFLYFYENKTVLGGFLGGLAGVELVKQYIGEKQPSGDLFTYPIILALIIGRIGCFSMGVYEETYGLPTSLPWGLNLGDGLQRHPVSLYEIIFLVLLWIGLVQMEKHYHFANGARFKLFMIAYLSFRLLLDFIKPHYTFNIGLSSIQVACVAGLVYYYRYITRPSLLLQPSTI